MSRRLVPLRLGLGPATLLAGSAEAAYREVEKTILRNSFSRGRSQTLPIVEEPPLQSKTPSLTLVREC
jgi:hypothetical protein